MSGSEVNIWRDKWIEGGNLQANINLVQGLPQVLSNLIDEDRTKWKLDSVRQVLTEQQVMAIQITLIIRREGKDIQVWAGSKDGR